MRVRRSITPEPVHSGNGLVQNATRSRGGTDSETDISHLPETAETFTQPVSLGPVPRCSCYTNGSSMGTLLQVDHPACPTTPEGPAPLIPPPTVRTRTEFPGIRDLITAEQALLLYSVLDVARAAKEVYNFEAEVCGGERQRTRQELEEVKGELVWTGDKFGVIDILRKYGKPEEAKAAMHLQIDTDHTPNQTAAAAPRFRRTAASRSRR